MPGIEPGSSAISTYGLPDVDRYNREIVKHLTMDEYEIYFYELHIMLRLKYKW